MSDLATIRREFLLYNETSGTQATESVVYTILSHAPTEVVRVAATINITLKDLSGA